MIPKSMKMLGLILFFMAGVQSQGFTCVNKTMTGKLQSEMTTVNCKDNGFSDKCMVTINGTPNNALVSHGCLPNNTHVSGNLQCGLTITGPGGNMVKTCCCNTSNCNDVEFLKRCLNSSLPIPTDRFTCHKSLRKPETNINYQYHDCTGKSVDQSHVNVCIVSVVINGAASAISSSCLPKDFANLPCNSSILNINNSTVRQCCCKTPMCNNAAFEEECAKATLPPLLTSTPQQPTTPKKQTTVDNGPTPPTTPPFECLFGIVNDENSVKGQTQCKEGEGINKCMVVIYSIDGKNVTARNCVERQTENFCGLSTSFNRTFVKYCCCDTQKCNNDDFLNDCRKRQLPTIPAPKGGFTTPIPVLTTPAAKKSSFHCVMSAGSLGGNNTFKTTQNCAENNFGDKCMVMVSYLNASTLITRSCMPNDNNCGKTLKLGEKPIKFCCCESHMCNNAEFVQDCVKSSTGGTIPTTDTSGLNTTTTTVTITKDNNSDQKTTTTTKPTKETTKETTTTTPANTNKPTTPKTPAEASFWCFTGVKSSGKLMEIKRNTACAAGINQCKVAVTSSDTNNEMVVTSGCGQCEETLNVVGETRTSVCCCSTNKCNTDGFVKNCKGKLQTAISESTRSEKESSGIKQNASWITIVLVISLFNVFIKISL